MKHLYALAQHIRQHEERVSPDMYNRCTSAHIPFHAHGFKHIQGIYVGPISEAYARRSGCGAHVLHDFVFHPGYRIFVDITADQFHPSLPDILLMHEHDERIATSKPTSLTTHLTTRNLVMAAENKHL